MIATLWFRQMVKEGIMWYLKKVGRGGEEVKATSRVATDAAAVPATSDSSIDKSST